MRGGSGTEGARGRGAETGTPQQGGREGAGPAARPSDGTDGREQVSRPPPGRRPVGAVGPASFPHGRREGAGDSPRPSHEAGGKQSDRVPDGTGGSGERGPATLGCLPEPPREEPALGVWAGRPVSPWRDPTAPHQYG